MILNLIFPNKARGRRSGVPLFCAFLFFFFFPQPSAEAEVYTDNNAYFEISVPDGWQFEEFLLGYKSELMFRSPEGEAVAVVIAELNSQNLLDLWLVKKEFIEEHRKRFPQGRFSLSKSSIAGFEAIKIDYAVPPITQQEFYIFFFDGVRFDLVYSATSSAAFEQYRDAVHEIFSSVKPLRRKLYAPR